MRLEEVKRISRQVFANKIFKFIYGESYENKFYEKLLKRVFCNGSMNEKENFSHFHPRQKDETHICIGGEKTSDLFLMDYGFFFNTCYDMKSFADYVWKNYQLVTGYSGSYGLVIMKVPTEKNYADIYKTVEFCQEMLAGRMCSTFDKIDIIKTVDRFGLIKDHPLPEGFIDNSGNIYNKEIVEDVLKAKNYKLHSNGVNIVAL